MIHSYTELDNSFISLNCEGKSDIPDNNESKGQGGTPSQPINQPSNTPGTSNSDFSAVGEGETPSFFKRLINLLNLENSNSQSTKKDENLENPNGTISLNSDSDSERSVQLNNSQYKDQVERAGGSNSLRDTMASTSTTETLPIDRDLNKKDSNTSPIALDELASELSEKIEDLKYSLEKRRDELDAKHIEMYTTLLKENLERYKNLTGNEYVPEESDDYDSDEESNDWGGE